MLRGACGAVAVAVTKVCGATYSGDAAALLLAANNLFRLLDVDGNGKLSYEELRAVFSTVVSPSIKLTAAAGKRGGPVGAATLLPAAAGARARPSAPRLAAREASACARGRRPSRSTATAGIESVGGPLTAARCVSLVRQALGGTAKPPPSSKLRQARRSADTPPWLYEEAALVLQAAARRRQARRRLREQLDAARLIQARARRTLARDASTDARGGACSAELCMPCDRAPRAETDLPRSRRRRALCAAAGPRNSSGRPAGRRQSGRPRRGRAAPRGGRTWCRPAARCVRPVRKRPARQRQARAMCQIRARRMCRTSSIQSPRWLRRQRSEGRSRPQSRMHPKRAPDLWHVGARGRAVSLVGRVTVACGCGVHTARGDADADGVACRDSARALCHSGSGRVRTRARRRARTSLA
eukprot:6225436-Prymnesium_polylepis.1